MSQPDLPQQQPQPHDQIRPNQADDHMCIAPDERIPPPGDDDSEQSTTAF